MDVLAALVAYLQAPEAVQCELALPRWRRARPQRPERPKFSREVYFRRARRPSVRRY
jgi:hypothetical protein